MAQMRAGTGDPSPGPTTRGGVMPTTVRTVEPKAVGR